MSPVRDTLYELLLLDPAHQETAEEIEARLLWMELDAAQRVDEYREERTHES